MHFISQDAQLAHLVLKLAFLDCFLVQKSFNCEQKLLGFQVLRCYLSATRKSNVTWRLGFMVFLSPKSAFFTAFCVKTMIHFWDKVDMPSVLLILLSSVPFKLSFFGNIAKSKSNFSEYNDLRKQTGVMIKICCYAVENEKQCPNQKGFTWNFARQNFLSTQWNQHENFIFTEHRCAWKISTTARLMWMFTLPMTEWQES